MYLYLDMYEYVWLFLFLITYMANEIYFRIEIYSFVRLQGDVRFKNMDINCMPQ